MSYTLPEFLAHAIAMEQEAADRHLNRCGRPPLQAPSGESSTRSLRCM